MQQSRKNNKRRKIVNATLKMSSVETLASLLSYKSYSDITDLLISL